MISLPLSLFAFLDSYTTNRWQCSHKLHLICLLNPNDPILWVLLTKGGARFFIFAWYAPEKQIKFPAPRCHIGSHGMWRSLSLREWNRSTSYPARTFGSWESSAGIQSEHCPPGPSDDGSGCGVPGCLKHPERTPTVDCKPIQSILDMSVKFLVICVIYLSSFSCTVLRIIVIKRLRLCRSKGDA